MLGLDPETIEKIIEASVCLGIIFIVVSIAKDWADR